MTSDMCSLRRNLSLAFLLALPAFAHAVTHTVTSLADDGSAGTLRALCASAADGDEIVFDTSLAGGTITLVKTLGPLEYAGSLTIEGPASAPVTIDGGAGSVDQGIAYAGNSRTTYLIHATGTAATTTLKNLVFIGSKANQSKDTPDVGPAVSILGNAVIDSCVWTNNGVARSGNFGSADGGGCLRVGGNLTLENSRFNKNGVSAGSSNFSLGAAVLAKGTTVAVTNCVFSETYGWGGSTTGSGNDIAAFAVGSATTRLTVEGCVFEKNLALHGGGALYIAGGSGFFSVRNCRFVENKNTNNGIKHGGALTFGGAGSYLVENCEFADNYCNGYGGAVRSQDTGASVVFANCTFVNNDGNDWGGAVDTRGPTWYVNCTAAGNVNRASNNNGPGTFFSTERSTVNILNGALVWNWSNNGTVKNDTSKYGGTVNVYNSYNYPAGSAPSKEENVTRNYDETTAFFAEPLASVSSMTCFGNTYNFSQAITTPVLSPAADAATPRAVEIDRDGVLLSTGWPVRHDADWSNIA